jgi:hypothetical protein
VTRYVTTCVITPSPPQVSHRERARVGPPPYGAGRDGGTTHARRIENSSRQRILTPLTWEPIRYVPQTTRDHGRPLHRPEIRPERETARLFRGASDSAVVLVDVVTRQSTAERKGVVGVGVEKERSS